MSSTTSWWLAVTIGTVLGLPVGGSVHPVTVQHPRVRTRRFVVRGLLWVRLGLGVRFGDRSSVVILEKQVQQRLVELACGVGSAGGGGRGLAAVSWVGKRLAAAEAPLGRGRVEDAGAYAGAHVRKGTLHQELGADEEEPAGDRTCDEFTEFATRPGQEPLEGGSCVV